MRPFFLFLFHILFKQLKTITDMLHFIRSRAKGWFAWVIVVLIIVPFALWGVQEYIGGGSQQGVAEVNGVDISQRDLQIAFQRQRERLQEMFGENFNPDMFPEEQMKQGLLQELIDRELLIQAARDNNMRISNQQLAEVIRSIEAFQKDGGFSAETYEQLLRSNGMSSGMFEYDLRRDMLTEQFRIGLTRSEFVTDAELANYLRLNNQQRDIAYMQLTSAKYKKGINISEEEILNYYDDNSSRYTVPEQVSLNYLELSVADIASAIKVSDDELRAAYETKAENYRSPEQRRARHILISLDSNSEDEAANKANELLTRLRTGESFDALAKEHSDDSGSAPEGGDLGYFERGVMTQVFENSVFALKQGELSEPVLSEFGYHIIRLESVKGGEPKPFEQVRGEILEELRREQAEDMFYDQAEELANLIYEHPDTLEEAADQLKLTIKPSESISRQGGKGLFAEPKVIAAAFSDDVLINNSNSEPVEISDNHIIVLRVREHKPQTTKPLAEVKAMISAQLHDDKAREAVQAVAEDLFARLNKDEAAKSVAKSAGMKWQREKKLSRSGTSIDRVVSEAAFRMARPSEENSATFELVSLPSGDQVIIALYGVIDGQVEDIAKERESDHPIEDAVARAISEAMLSRLRTEADIIIR